jgi:hypothetical protein
VFTEIKLSSAQEYSITAWIQMTSVIEVSTFSERGNIHTCGLRNSFDSLQCGTSSVMSEKLWNLKYQDLKILIRERPETCSEIGLIDFIEDDELVPYNSLRFISESLENDQFIDPEDQYPTFLAQFPNLREYRTFYSCSYSSGEHLEFLLNDLRATHLYLRIEIDPQEDRYKLSQLQGKLETSLQKRIIKHGAGIIFYVELIDITTDTRQICGFYSGTLICSSKVKEVERLIELTSATQLATENPKVFQHFIAHCHGLISVGFIEPLDPEIPIPFPRHIDSELQEIHFYEATPQNNYGFNYKKTLDEIRAFEYCHRIRVIQGLSLQIRANTKASQPSKHRILVQCRKFPNIKRFQLPIPISTLRVFEELFPNVVIFSLMETFQKRYYNHLAAQCVEVEREYKRRIFK